MTTDCEKFEPLLLDELYEELDELTSAALKRHVSGCARCKASLDGMRATRRLVSLPMVEPPAGLEDRIFAAAKEAQKVVPIKSRFSRVVSIAGAWAMRPQTAMAAVFLLMIGSSAFLLRSSKRDAAREAQVSVTVAGSPQAAATAASESDRLDDKSAAAAHGPIVLPPAAVAAAPAPSSSAVALNEDADSTMGRLATAAKGGKADEGNALGSIAADDRAEAEKKSLAARSAGGGGGYGGPSNAGTPGGAPAAGDPYASQQMQQPLSKRGGPADGAQDSFSLGTAAYRARNFSEAAKQFDAAAQSGDQNAALWAARAVKEGQGCATALGRFESVAQKAPNEWHRSEASLEAARCQIAMGNLDPARDRLNHLAQVPSHAAPAKQALAELDEVASRRAGHVSGGAQGAGRAAPAPAPAKAAAKPAATANSADRPAAGF